MGYFIFSIYLAILGVVAYDDLRDANQPATNHKA